MRVKCLSYRCLLILILGFTSSFHFVYAGLVPHAAIGDLKYNDNTTPQSVSFSAYIVGRSGETLNQNDLDCNYSNGSWQVQCGNFPTNWNPGEVLHVDFNDGSGFSGSIEVTLTNQAFDDAGQTTLMNSSDNIKLSAGDLTATHGDVIEVPIYMDGIQLSDSLLAFELEVGFDTELLLPVEATQQNTMIANWEMLISAPKAETIDIAGFTSNSSSTALIADGGILLNVKFISQGDPNQQTTESAMVRILDAVLYTMDETYVVRHTKTGAMTFQPASSTVTRQISLGTGWNLISLGVTPETNSLPEVFGAVDAAFVSTFFSGGTGYRTWGASRPSFLNDLLVLDGLHGYWVNSAEINTVSWSVIGTSIPVTTPIILYPNWNLVAYLPDDEYALDESLQSLGQKVSAATGYLGASEGFKTWGRDRPSFLNDLNSMAPGLGYWIKLDTTGTLTYPQNGTPISKRLAKFDQNDQVNEISQMPQNCDFWALQPETLSLGDTITVFDPQNVMCGDTVVVQSPDNPNDFAFLVHVSGDDPLTVDVDEGAEPGDTLSFYINHKQAAILGVSENGDNTYKIQTGVSPVFVPNGDMRIRLMKVSDSNVASNSGRMNDFQLYANYPNPFNPNTLIPFQLAGTNTISLHVYDVTGKLIRKLIDNAVYPAGKYAVQWQGDNDNGSKVASGVYMIQLRSDHHLQVKKCILIQ